MRNYLKYTLLAWALPLSIATATTLNVPVDQLTIQAGIDSASVGDTVLVQPSTYVENINFNGKNIVVGSLFLTTGDTSYIPLTVIDGNQTGSVVTFDNNEDRSAVLSGFTIRNGSSGNGGGIRCQYSSPTLTDLIVTANRDGGGIHIFSGGGTQNPGFVRPSPLIRNTIISNNRTTMDAGGIGFLEGTAPILENVIITGNTSQNGSGGVYTYESNATLINVSILDCKDFGGNQTPGIVQWQADTLVIINSLVWNGGITSEAVIHARYCNIQGGFEGEGNMDANPILLSESDHPYQPHMASPLIGAGIDSIQIDGVWYHAPSLDIFGNERPSPQGSPPDIGAYEIDVAVPQSGINLSAIADTSLQEDSQLQIYLEAEHQMSLPLIYEISGSDNIGVVVKADTIILIPNPNFSSVNPNILYARACDGYVCSEPDTFLVTVIPINDQPTATLESISVSDQNATLVSLTGNPGPPNESGQTLTYIVLSLPAYGSLSLTENGDPIQTVELPLVLSSGQIYFQPPEDRFYVTTMKYLVSDDGGTDFGGVDISDTATVILTMDVSTDFKISTAGPIEGGVTLIDNSTIYAAASGDKVYRFDNSGSIEYTLNVNGDIKSSTTLTPDHTVYIASTDNNLYSFNASGVSNPNWPLALGAEATASVAMDADKNIYIGTQNGIFQAVSPDGLVMWAYNVGGAVYASAAISLDNTLYIVNHNGRLYAFDLSTLNPANVQYKWRIETGGNVISSPALDDSSHVYLTTLDGRLLKVLDENTTGTVVWEFNTGAPIESSPVVGSDYSVYFGCDNGKVYAVDKAGSLKWEQTTGGPVKSTAALVEQGTETDRLYIGSNDGYLYALSLTDGAIIWRYNAQSEIKAPTLYLDGRIYTGTIGGHIIALSDPDVGQSLAKSTGARRIWPTFQGDNARTGYQGSTALNVPIDVSYLPSTYKLHQSYPNPFNPTSTIQFDLPEATDITLVIYDLLGREIVRIADGWREAGYHQAIWNGQTSSGHEVPTGIYIARLLVPPKAGVTPEFTKSIKMVLLK